MCNSLVYGGIIMLYCREIMTVCNSLVYGGIIMLYCREIMTVCNSLVYGGRLQCGSDEVATRRLSLPFYPSQHSGGGVGSWIDGVLHPWSPVLFLDTDGCTEATEDSTGNHICNRFEAKLVARLFVRLTMVITVMM